MDNAPLPPCSELGQGPEHTLLYWMSTHVNNRGIIRDFDHWRQKEDVVVLLDGATSSGSTVRPSSSGCSAAAPEEFPKKFPHGLVSGAQQALGYRGAVG